MRKFALVILSDTDKVIDRYNIDIVENPTGLGFALNIQTIKTDINEILVKATQQLKPINFNVVIANGNEYAKAKALRYWIEKNTRNRMALEWTNATGVYYTDCRVQEFNFTEIKEDKLITIPMTLKILSPLFEAVEDEIKIYPAKGGKLYPYTYPYSYGSGVISNNIIENSYIEDLPLIIKIYGSMENPYVGIRRQGESQDYGQVVFKNLTLAEDQFIIINAVTKKIQYFNGVNFEDGYNYLDATKDSFIFAEGNTTSVITASVQSNKTGRLVASFRRYRL